MKQIGLALIVLACAVALVASALDVRCIAMQPGAGTLIVACRAGRITTRL